MTGPGAGLLVNGAAQSVNTVGTLMLALVAVLPDTMAVLDASSTVQPLVDLDAGAILASLALGVGVLGSFLGLFGDEEGTDSDETDDDVFGEGGGDLDDMDGFDDMGGLEDMDGFDDVGGMEEGLGGEAGAEGGSEDIERRVDELETELGEVSSTVSTVRSENEQISETVDDVEENVRKLLDIYEMVTRGVNPFVDDAAGSAFDEGAGGLGLFETDDADSGEEEIDEDLASADAEEFFDDGFADLDGDEGFDDDGFDALDDDGFDDVEPGTPDGTTASADGPGEPVDAGDSGPRGGDDGDSGDGMSFEELKQEYDQGADWADGEDEPGAAAEPSTDEGSEPPDVVVDDPANVDGADDPLDAETGADPATAGTAEPAEAEPAVEVGSSEAPGEDAEDSVPERYHGGRSASARREPAGRGRRRRKPYLSRLPGEYTVDLAVMEWLSYLVDESDAADAHRAIAYYRTVGWITETVEEELHADLGGISGGEDETTATEPAAAPDVRPGAATANGSSPGSDGADETDEAAGADAPVEDLGGLEEADAPTGTAFAGTDVGAGFDSDSVARTDGSTETGGDDSAADGSADPVPAPVGLTVEHHTESLRQIARFAGDPEGELLEAYRPPERG